MWFGLKVETWVGCSNMILVLQHVKVKQSLFQYLLPEQCLLNNAVWSAEVTLCLISWKGVCIQWPAKYRRECCNDQFHLANGSSKTTDILVKTVWVMTSCGIFSSSLPLQPSLALASLVTDAHSLQSKATVLHLFTPIFLKSNWTSSYHHNFLGLPFLSPLLVCLPVTSLLSFHHPILKRAEAIPIYVFTSVTLSADLHFI